MEEAIYELLFMMLLCSVSILEAADELLVVTVPVKVDMPELKLADAVW